jgi:hypothetical protein
MMQGADLRNRGDASDRRHGHGTRRWRVLLEGEVRARSHIVLDVFVNMRRSPAAFKTST